MYVQCTNPRVPILDEVEQLSHFNSVSTEVLEAGSTTCDGDIGTA